MVTTSPSCTREGRGAEEPTYPHSPGKLGLRCPVLKVVPPRIIQSSDFLTWNNKNDHTDFEITPNTKVHKFFPTHDSLGWRGLPQSSTTDKPQTRDVLRLAWGHTALLVGLSGLGLLFSLPIELLLSRIPGNLASSLWDIVRQDSIKKTFVQTFAHSECSAHAE